VFESVQFGMFGSASGYQIEACLNGRVVNPMAGHKNFFGLHMNTYFSLLNIYIYILHIKKDKNIKYIKINP
jgi:hypothetical protein